MVPVNLISGLELLAFSFVWEATKAAIRNPYIDMDWKASLLWVASSTLWNVMLGILVWTIIQEYIKQRFF